MLSILICHSYYLRLDPKQLERAKPYPPLATLQVAAMLRKAGHKIALFDAMLAEGVEDYDRMLRATAPQVVILYEDTFNFLSKMCLGEMRAAACRMIGAAQRAGAMVIAAGPDVSDAPEPYLRAGADATLIGEGLAALMELLLRLDSRPEVRGPDLLDGLRGVRALRAGAMFGVEGAAVLPASRFDGLAAWDLVDIDRYRTLWLENHGYFSLNMAGSRGCSFRCAWCAKPTWGNHYLQRSASSVASEMTHLKRQFDPQHIWFADDIFGFRVDWVRQFGAVTRVAGGEIPFTIQTRADLLSVPMVEALQGAGCREVWLGAESGSQRVLDAMNKGTTLDQILTARHRLKQAHIRVGFFIQLGYMGEQLTDILATRNLLRIARPDEIGVSVSYPLPGTKFHDLVKAQLGAKTRWKDSSDLDMMFQGTYGSGFYRAVRTLLHDQIARQGSCDEADLEQRWQELLGQEAQHRSPERRPMAAAARCQCG